MSNRSGCRQRSLVPSVRGRPFPGRPLPKLSFTFGDFAQHVLDQALALHGVGIVGYFRDRLGKCHHDLVGIDDFRLAARRAIFRENSSIRSPIRQCRHGRSSSASASSDIADLSLGMGRCSNVGVKMTNNSASRRVSNETPIEEARCLVAPSVRFSVRAIFDAGVFCRASDLSTRISSLVHARRFDFLAIKLSVLDCRFLTRCPIVGQDDTGKFA